MTEEFDYETAWVESAEPAFKALPADIDLLVRDTCAIANNLRQDSNCDMIWPEDSGSFRDRFDVFDDATLARASRVVHRYQHWSPGIVRVDENLWKFSNYCDQVLRARFGLARSVDSGLGFTVIEGALRVSVSRQWCWSWREVGLATKENLQKVRDLFGKIQQPAQDAPRKAQDSFTTEIMKQGEALGKEFFPRDEPVAGVFDSSRYMVPKGTIDARHAAKRQQATDARLEIKIESMAAVVRALRDFWSDNAQNKIKLFLRETGASRELCARVLAKAEIKKDREGGEFSKET